MAGDYVPHSELKLISWAEKFVGFLEDHAAETGLPPEELAAVRSEFDEFASAFAAHDAARVHAKAMCSVKDDARRPLVNRLRSIATRVKVNMTIDAEVKNGARAVIGKSPRHPRMGVSDDRPHAIIDTGQRLRHIFRIMNENTQGIHKARPSDVVACELWRRNGDGTGDWKYVGGKSGKPFAILYREEDSGKQVQYRLRWVGRQGVKGGWSGIKIATIAA